jgi:mycothiol synthase
MSAQANRYTIRRPKRNDLADVLQLCVACDVDEQGQIDTTIEDVATQWNQPGFTLRRDAWLAERTGEASAIVAYAWIEVRTPGKDLEADIVLHPAHRDDALGRDLLARAARRAADLAGGAPSGAHASLGVFCAAANEWKRELLESEGFVPARTFLRMRIDMGRPAAQWPIPQGLDLRVFRPESDARAVKAALDEAFADEFWTRRQSFDQWEQRLLSRPEFDPSLWFVAWDGDVVAGAIVAYDFGDIGWVQGLGVRAPWRGRGAGLALLTRALAAFHEHGRPTVCLGVDAENETGATRLYERAGMHVTLRWTLYRRRLAPA